MTPRIARSGEPVTQGSFADVLMTIVSTPGEDSAFGRTRRPVSGDGTFAHLGAPDVQSISNVRSPAEENISPDEVVSKSASTRIRDDARGMELNRRSSVSKQEFR